MKQRCNAKNRQGEPCGNYVVKGREKCRFHGGLTPRGEDSPNYRHGKRSRYKPLPGRMVEAYERSKNDPDLHDLREDIALLDARLSDVLGRVDSGEAGKHWGKLVTITRDLRTAYQVGDTGALALGLNELWETVQKGRADWTAWHEVVNLVERRRKMVESDVKLLKDKQAMISAEEAMALIGEIYMVLQEEISDSATLDRIGRKLTLRLTRPNVIEARAPHNGTNDQ